MNSIDLEILTKRFILSGIPGIQSHLDGLPAGQEQRLVVLNSIRKAVDTIYIENKQLDRMYEIYEACIAEALAIADSDEEFISFANVTSYNLAANLADCWLDAKETRYKKHYEAGIEAARRCLDLRIQLNKPPPAMAMAYFILGVHQYSLKQYTDAEKSWLLKLENELTSQETQFQENEDLNVELSRGLIGLARWSQGSENGGEYKESLRCLAAKRNLENFEEIDLFVSELRLLKQKHGPKIA